MNDLMLPSLSFLQKQMLPYIQHDNNLFSQCVIQINDTLDYGKLLTMIHQVIDRHEVLRTRYYTSGGITIPKICSNSVFIYSVHDFSELTPQEGQLRAQEILNSNLLKPFNNIEDFPLSIEVFCISDDLNILSVRASTLAVDSQSLKNIVFEIFALYNDKKLPEAEIIQYGRYSEWLNRLAESPDEDAIYFWEKYDCQNTSNRLSFEKKNVKPSAKSLKKTTLKVENNLLNLDAFAEARQMNASSVVLAAFSSLIFQRTNDEEIVIGNIINNRDYKELDSSVGLISKTLPVLVKLNVNLSFDRLAEQIQNTVEEVIGWGNYYFSSKQETYTDDRGRWSVGFEFIDLSDLFSDQSCSLISFESNIEKFKLKLFLKKFTDSYSIDFYYHPDYFEEGEIEVLKNQFGVLLNNALRTPEKTCSLLQLSDQRELDLVLNSFSPCPSKTAITYGSIVQAFQEQVEKNPQGIAIEFEGTSLSYQQLDFQSTKLASYLISNYDIKQKDCVAVIMNRSEKMIISLLGILKTGAAYLPIDPSTPAERKKYCLDDSDCKVLITESAYMFDLPDYTKELFAFDVQFEGLEDFDESPSVKIEGQDLAYIIYTSGSTGIPKGVKISHYSLINYVEWFILNYKISKEDTGILFSSIAFDLSYTTLWPSLASGAKLCLHRESKYLEVDVLLNDLIKNNITFIKLTPSHFRMLLMALDFPEAVKKMDLRLIVLGGEEINPEDIEMYFRYNNKVKFVNHFGPTETTIGSIAQNIDFLTFERFKSIPVIGRPICNNNIFIMNNRVVCAIGVPGEIAIGGPGLSSGYLNRPELTSEKFIESEYGKLYLTGDMGKWLADGSIEFLGRKDNQVKVRGYRIELGEIDEVLNNYLFVKEGVALINPSEKGEKEIRAYVVVGKEFVKEEFKKYLNEKLFEYMIPSQIIEIEKMPLTLNGKVDRKKLLLIEKAIEKEYAGPRNKIEAELLKIWEEVLGRKPIGINEDFFELGGHSLKAVQIVSRIYKELNVKIELRNIFESSTITELAEVVKVSEEKIFEDIVPVDKQDYYEVSHAQKRLWILDQMEESKIAYNRPATYVFEGDLNKEAFAAAFEALVKRHESLRTTFMMVEGELKQVVHDSSEFSFKVGYIDLRNEDDKEKKAQELARNESFIAFDLSDGPLLRTQLLHLDENLYVFLFTIHHIISDGWSIKVLIQEILSLYHGITKDSKFDLPPLKIQYKDYAAWQNQQLSGEKIREHQEYWWKIFSGDIPVLNLPLDFPRPPVKTYNGNITGILLSKVLTKSLNDLSRKHGASLFMTLISSLSTLLYRYTGQKDIIIGSPIAGREHGDLEDQIGFYVNTLALRVQFDEDESFETLLNRVKELTLGSYKHQIYPYDRLVDDLDLDRDRSRTPLFDVNLVLQNTDIGNVVGQKSVLGIENVAVRNFETEFYSSKYDLLFHCNEEDEVLSIFVEYNTDLFKKSTIQRLLANFNNLLQSVVQNSQLELMSYDFISVEEKQLLLSDFNNTLTNYPPQNIIDLFHKQVKSNPDEIALLFNDSTVTYKQLELKANQLAQFLVENHGARPIAAVLLDNSIHTIVAILGTLKAGGTFLPLDPNHPYDRIKFILSDAKAKVLLSEKKFIKFLNKLQWECADLDAYVCLDSDNPSQESEELNELMKEELWDYVGSNHDNVIEVGGWVSSYTGEALSKTEMEEYASNVLVKLKPYLTKQTRVLEIGCSSGISMFGIAPFVKEYYGTDLSAKILEYTQKEVDSRGFDNIKLFHLPAHRIEELNAGFDLVVINSVVQSFNGYNYLKNVLRQAVNLLNDSGIIFLGDLQNLELKNALIQSLTDFKNNNSGKGYKTKVDWSNELFVHQQFLNDLIYDIPEIEYVTHSDKIATIKNELTEFRYDSMLSINKEKILVKKDLSQKTKKQWGVNDLLNHSSENIKYPINSDDHAYIIYTSGSTGNPKGVQISHQSIYNYISWANNTYFHTAPGNMALITSIAFDLTLTSIFSPLTRGKKLFIYPSDDITVVMRDCFLNLEVDTLKLTPSHINLSNHLPVLYTGLQQVIVGGEELKSTHINILKSFNPEMRIYNEYGPTENTIGCTMAEVTEQYIEIGKPISNTKVYVLDENRNLLPIGCTGEICTSGVCLAKGYVNNSELTDQKFILNPFDPEEKLYMTGDLGRWLENGTLEWEGRKDDQIKIRGYRIELGEIEKILLTFNHISNCKVIVREAEEKQLIAYFTSSKEIDTSDLRKYLKELLPFYMVPEYFVALESFPLTSNGKVNIKLLPNVQNLEVSNNSNYVAPVTTVEKELVAIWEEILKKDNIGIRDNFFDLGGHSLKATQVITRIYKNLNKSITLNSIFSSPTIEEIARLVSDEQYVEYHEIKSMPEQEYYDLSHAQRRLWILDQLEENQSAYNMPGSLTFYGDLNREKLSMAFHTLLERHESLRTTFITIDGEPKQKIHPAGTTKFKLEYIDLKNKIDSEEISKNIAFNTLKESFDLENGPLIRAKLLHLEENKYVFLFSMHHIISDGWSMDILISEVLTLYNAYIQSQPNPLVPLSIQYKDYVYWQNNMLKGGEIERQQQYWMKKFAGTIPKLNIPTDYARPSLKTYNGESRSFAINKTDTLGLNNLNQEYGTTLFMSLVSFVKILLHKYSGQEDIIIGSPIAGRDHKDLENQIGFYLNTLPIRTNITGSQTLQDLLLQVKETTLEAYSYQLYPFDKLVEDLNLKVDRSRSPLFDVMVVLQNTNHVESDTDQSLQGVYVEGYNTNWTPSKFDLSFYFAETGDQIQAKIVYNTDLFRSERIELMISEFQSLINNGLLNKTQSISDLALAYELAEDLNIQKIDFDFSF